jgi:EAL and modified HD-GYP domain-containing signal transduction protein
VLVARQPIFDRSLSVCGYELLFRPAPLNGPLEAPAAATASVLMGAFADLDPTALAGGMPAYVNVTRDLLLQLGELPLSPNRVVLELVEDQVIDEALIDVVRGLVDSGFVLALDDFVYSPELEPLIDLAEIVKVEVLDRLPDAVFVDYERLRGRVPVLLAEKVETRAEYETYRAMGFDRFQGFFFARPKELSGHAVGTSRGAEIRTLAAVQSCATFEELQAVIECDAGLSYRLLRWINSAYFGMARNVRSVHEALIMLGFAPVRRWATIAVMAGFNDAPPHLMTLALVRAELCAALSDGTRPDADCLFTVGLLSTLDGLAQQPMGDAVASLPLAPDVRAALLEREGRLGESLAAVEDYENGAPARDEHPGMIAALGTVYPRAVARADALAREL